VVFHGAYTTHLDYKREYAPTPKRLAKIITTVTDTDGERKAKKKKKIKKIGSAKGSKFAWCIPGKKKEP